jgi:putative ABC transport system permease protein
VTRLTLRGLLARKLRTFLTAVAIVLGVALVSGTFILTDTIEKAFDSIFASSYERTDAVVSGRKLLEYSQTGKALVPEELLARVRQLPEVEAATGSLVDFSGNTDQAKIVDEQGEVLDGNGAPTFGFGIDPSEERFNPFTLAQGRWAEGPDEVVVDAATASRHGVEVGDRIGVAAEGPVDDFTVVGIARFGEVDSIGSATIALFDVPTAQALLDKDGFDTISIAANPGVSEAELLAAVGEILPAGYQVQTGAAQADEDGSDIAEVMDWFRWILLAFGGIALFVGGFVIFNTLSITVAQRTRELATLRTLGASKRQVRRSVVLEALVTGLAASAVGLALGVALAKGLNEVFVAVGIDLPQAGTVFTARTAVVPIVAGTLITVLAGLVPALRATRVPPVAAVREGATLPRSRSARLAPALAIASTALAAAALAVGLFQDGVESGTRILAVAVGLVGLFLGVAVLAARLVPALAALVGRPAALGGGVAGELARRNAVRNPSRTAATAAALMIGLALVTFVAVLGKGLTDSATGAVERQLAADWVVTSQSGWDTVPAAAGKAVAAAPAVELASSVRSDRARLAGSEIDVSGVDPATIARVFDFAWASGSDEALASLGSQGAILRSSFAEEKGLQMGDRVALTTPDGGSLALRVAGVFEPSRFDPLLGHVLVTQETFDGAFPRPSDLYTFVRGGTEAGLEEALAAYPDTKLRTEAGFASQRASDWSSAINLLYVLLALSVVVSLFGMVNTLVLSVIERRREIGMLRTVGLSRRQVRRMVRRESVVTAAIGAALGMPLGILLAALTTRALAGYDVGFSLPVGTLAAFSVVAIVAGVVSAVLPARRAARLDVLRALQYE